jgi:adenylosuccinate lyase
MRNLHSRFQLMHDWWLATQAPPELVNVWTPIRNVEIERCLWQCVLRFHVQAGVAPAAAVRAYAAAAPYVNLQRIDEREHITRHDVMARIAEYNYLAGFECIHLGMTSADVVDNVAQIKMAESVRVLHRLDPQRFAPALRAVERWPMRGIKGAIGTQQDQCDLLGSQQAAVDLDRAVAAEFDFYYVLDNVGQVYPRSLDLEIVSTVAGCVTDVRHPMQSVLLGYLSIVAGYAGETWNEGDVSTSVSRRVALPGALFAVGALALAAEPPPT